MIILIGALQECNFSVYTESKFLRTENIYDFINNIINLRVT